MQCVNVYTSYVLAKNLNNFFLLKYNNISFNIFKNIEREREIHVMYIKIKKCKSDDYLYIYCE